MINLSFYSSSLLSSFFASDLFYSSSSNCSYLLLWLSARILICSLFLFLTSLMLSWHENIIYLLLFRLSIISTCNFLFTGVWHLSAILENWFFQFSSWVWSENVWVPEKVCIIFLFKFSLSWKPYPYWILFPNFGFWIWGRRASLTLNFFYWFDFKVSSFNCYYFNAKVLLSFSKNSLNFSF